MKRNRWISAIGALALVTLVSCSAAAEAALEAPAEVEEMGDGLSRLTLTRRAVERLAIETAPVTSAGGRRVVPYAAIFYDADGQAWVYTSLPDRVYVRAPVAVERIDGDASVAVLASGPPIGTKVVTVGVIELWGTETGVGGGH